MWLLLSGSLAGFVTGAGLFAFIFRRQHRWGWGYLVALICNIPTIVLAYFIKSGVVVVMIPIGRLCTTRYRTERVAVADLVDL